MTDQPSILVDRRDGYRVVTLNRPERLNAFNETMHRALRAALDEAEADDGCGALLLTGAGRAFCSGQDLSDRMPGSGPPRDLGASLDSLYNPLVRQLRALPFPVVAAVNGTAAGAGASLALHCDIVLAARSARFVQAFAKIGVVPDAGGSWLLPRLVGAARAHRRAAGGREGGRMGADLEGRRRRPAGRRGRVTVRAVRSRAAPRLEPDQARARGGGAERPQRPARPRARPAAQGRIPSRLCRGGACLHGKENAEFRGPERQLG
jgi:hypothetical protein